MLGGGRGGGGLNANIKRKRNVYTSLQYSPPSNIKDLGGGEFSFSRGADYSTWGSVRFSRPYRVGLYSIPSF